MSLSTCRLWSKRLSLYSTPNPLLIRGLTSKKNPYSHTLQLPKTSFPLRADAAKREHLFRDRTTKDLYPWQLSNNPKDLFVLHDGPPYANGSVHCGHAMNKILKDVVNRCQVLNGRRVHYRPGWDCHGLPIEMKVLEALREKGKHERMSPTVIRRLARQRALQEIDKQRKSFMSWGVMGEWDHPYRTLDKDYEIRQLGVFHDMVKKGYIYRQLKPVYWSPSSMSALAESELEYKEDHKSRSIHVRFPLTKLAPAIQEKWEALAGGPANKIHAVIWTTTPWTMPANKAISVHPDMEYSLARCGAHIYVVAKDRVTALASDWGQPLQVLDTVLGSDLLGSQYEHPLWKNAAYPVIGGTHVTSESGTGLVHTAPGHGMEDYEVCKSLGISPFSPVDDKGIYTNEVSALGLEGLEAFGQGTQSVLELLRMNSAIVAEQDYLHNATAQWFANVEQLQKQAVEALTDIQMVPSVSFRRLEQFTLSRKEWCISRQRAWGVPIPALYNIDTNEPLLTEDNVKHIIDTFDSHGSTDIWWEAEDDQLFVAPQYRDNGKTYRRGYDTMDVWFDSGTSWTMLKDLPDRSPGQPLADMYLEGSDQHRGWFQSSLLTSIALTGQTPYKTLVTHGFALDEDGRKMSKSLGNTLEPAVITEGGKDKKKNPAYGSDVLRMWVANCEYTRDVSIGPNIIAQTSEIMRKIRTTSRFMLGNLFDFDHTKKVDYKYLSEIDRCMLHELYAYNNNMKQAYGDYAFSRAMQQLQNFTNVQLSAFYFDVIKDRLYNDAPGSASRRMAQSVLYEILQSYTTSLAPVACHTAEEIYEHYRDLTPDPQSSIFKVGWHRSLPSQWHQPQLEAKWQMLKQIKTEVNQVLEQARQEKLIRSSQEANIHIAVAPSRLSEVLSSISETELASYFLTSNVYITQKAHSPTYQYQREITLDSDRCSISATVSKDQKCPRCWNYHADNENSLCSRCSTVCS
ncbi:isoleucyl-tRNA synthetase [Hesseltinella vesiculosa]|uniref:Isoleucine--tRNA ligase, mitochondrial n=1 Tax=Hesseltinella vesiculosa TaxID=101127 RepID=A0A1X2GDP3_9FUNG|nr:isoleucyl-tRNA synthetase [Hesseltinella vesiculosa]